MCAAQFHEAQWDAREKEWDAWEKAWKVRWEARLRGRRRLKAYNEAWDGARNARNARDAAAVEVAENKEIGDCEMQGGGMRGRRSGRRSGRKFQAHSGMRGRRRGRYGRSS